MDTAIRTVQLIRMALLASIVLYVVVGEILGSKSLYRGNQTIFFALAGMTISIVVGIFAMRRILVLPSQTVLASNSSDLNALNRWRTGYIVIYAMSEAIAMFGLVLRVTGFTLTQVVPFYIAGVLLILYFSPRQPSDQMG